MLYNNLSAYLREKYGRRLKKICIDGGFSCPNRDGKCGTGGCIFCGERGSGEHIDALLSIKDQVKGALLCAKEEDIFIAYFQNFTNTYAEIDVLKARYDEALIDKRIRILSVGTRPDCIDEDVAKLLASYKERLDDVWVELGLQTSNESTAKIINRGYTNECFERAIGILKAYGIKVIVHMIIGLPSEEGRDALESAKYIGAFSPFGVKIHSIYVMRGTKLASLYENNLYTPPTLEEYIDTAARVIASLPKSIILHRLTGDCPRDMLIAPDWNTDKMKVIDLITKRLEELGLSQGSLI